MNTAATMGVRVLPREEDDPERLLDRGMSLLDGLADDPVPTLRWYRATATAIVLGRGQRRLAVEPSDEVRVVMRSSGGGAVLLDSGMLSLDVLLPAGHPWLDGDVGAVFLRVGEAWADGLARLGVPGLSVHRGPSTTPRRETSRGRLIADVCYASVGRGEVLHEGRKLVGLAQRRRRHGTLVQCGLLRTWRPGRLLAALGSDPADEEIAGAAVGLDDLLPAPPQDRTIIAAVGERLATGLRTADATAATEASVTPSTASRT